MPASSENHCEEKTCEAFKDILGFLSSKEMKQEIDGDSIR